VKRFTPGTLMHEGEASIASPSLVVGTDWRGVYRSNRVSAFWYVLTTAVMYREAGV
jgi:hypothetical protein